MEPKIIALAILAFSFFSLTSCGTSRPESSETKNIATDLPDRLGGGPTNLYWVNADRVFRGTCRVSGPNGTPAIPSNCDSNIKSMRYAEFKQKLDNGLSQTITDLTNEAQRLREIIISVQEQIAQTLTAIAEQERLGGPTSSELQKLQQDMQEFQGFVTELKDQLTLIDTELRRLNSQDLVMQRDIVVRQLSDYQRQVAEIAAAIPAMVTKIGNCTVQLETLRRQLASLQVRLDNLQLDLTQVTSKLQLACDDFGVYGDTLAKLTSGITYSVLTDNIIARQNRQFVKRFETIFSTVP